MADIRTRFPDWNTDAALGRWAKDREKLVVGQHITGEVVATAPFGIWLDIGVSFPALLHFFSRDDSSDGPLRWEGVDAIGDTVVGRIQGFGHSGEIFISQRDLDNVIDGSAAHL